MPMRLRFQDWPRLAWKLVKNPTFEVVAAIAAVLLAAWWIVESGELQRSPETPFVRGLR